LQSDVPGFREEFVEPVDRAAFGHASDQVGDKVDLWLTVTFLESSLIGVVDVKLLLITLSP
jgi:hypothetical protein